MTHTHLTWSREGRDYYVASNGSWIERSHYVPGQWTAHMLTTSKRVVRSFPTLTEAKRWVEQEGK